MTDQQTPETSPRDTPDDEHPGFTPKALLGVLLLAAVPVTLALVIAMRGDSVEKPPEPEDVLALPRESVVSDRQLLPENTPAVTLERPQRPAPAPPQTTRRSAVRNSTQAATPEPPETAAAQIAPPLDIALLTPHGSNPVYNLNDELEFTVDLSRSAYVYCYYQDATGAIARIFPNRFQPDPFVDINAPLRIPGAESRFSIVFELPASIEVVGCFASEGDIDASLPAALQQDLTPLPIDSLEQVAAALAQQSTTNIAWAHLQIHVN